MSAEPILDAELAAFLQSGISMHVGTAAALVPQIARGAACVVSADRRTITIFLASANCAAVLADVAANGAVAATFTKPKSHRTVQLKGQGARVRPATAADLAQVERQVVAFAAELASIGFPADLGRTVNGGRGAAYVALSFAPASAFVQTPGPAAGTALKGP